MDLLAEAALASHESSQPARDKARWSISTDAKQLLEDVFEATPFPERHIKAELAAKLDCSERQITVWFQNRRQCARFGPKRQRTSPPMNDETAPPAREDDFVTAAVARTGLQTDFVAAAAARVGLQPEAWPVDPSRTPPLVATPSLHHPSPKLLPPASPALPPSLSSSSLQASPSLSNTVGGTDPRRAIRRAAEQKTTVFRRARGSFHG